MRKLNVHFLAVSLFMATACTSDISNQQSRELEKDYSSVTDTAYFAGGCFWCVEASFEQLKGIPEVISGYAGGSTANPTYDLVSAGRTDHAEAVMVLYDSSVIQYETLLDIFFTAHDPTQLNRQGPDVGRQYRSIAFYTSIEEKNMIKDKIDAIQSEYRQKIVTVVQPLDIFYPAEDYHQDYEEHHTDNTYIQNVSKPKIEKVAKKFNDRLKDQ